MRHLYHQMAYAFWRARRRRAQGLYYTNCYSLERGAAILHRHDRLIAKHVGKG